MTTTDTNPTNERISVADYLSRQIAASPKKQTEIAAEVGYPPNMVWMIKKGSTKLPIPKVAAFAQALNIDPVHLLRIVMEEYQSESWGAIEEIIGNRMVTDDEMQLIWIVRSESFGNNVCPKTEEEINELKALVAKWRERTLKEENAQGANRPKPAGRPVAASKIEKIQ